MPTQWKFSAEFKVKVARDALSGELALAELASEMLHIRRRLPVGGIKPRKAWWQGFSERLPGHRRMLRPKFANSMPR